MIENKNDREVRFVSIPEGLHQERVDAALSRLLGLSRSTIVILIENDEVTRKGKPLTKSDRVNTDDYLEIKMPAILGEPVLTATPIDNFKVVYDDSAIDTYFDACNYNLYFYSVKRKTYLDTMILCK